MRQYCIDNTKVDATLFTRYGAGNEPTYAFWIAEDGVFNSQELFIFREAQWGMIKRTTRWNRFSFVDHASGGADEIVSSVMFTPRDSKNKKTTTNVIVFYSSNKHNISRHIFTIEEDGKICTEEHGSSTSQAFVSVISVGVKDGVLRKFVKAEFFDGDGNLVETILGDGQTYGE